MAKGFSKNNPLDKLSGTSVPKIKDVQKEPMAAVEPRQTEMEQKQEKPQTAHKWEDIKIVHGSNLTSYIIKLMEKDINANYERYKGIADSLKNI